MFNIVNLIAYHEDPPTTTKLPLPSYLQTLRVFNVVDLIAYYRDPHTTTELPPSLIVDLARTTKDIMDIRVTRTRRGEIR